MTWFDWSILDFIQNHLRSGGMDTLMVWITTLGDRKSTRLNSSHWW